MESLMSCLTVFGAPVSLELSHPLTPNGPPSPISPHSLLLSLASLKQRLVSPASFLSTSFLPILWLDLSKWFCSLWWGKGETEFTRETVSAQCFVICEFLFRHRKMHLWTSTKLLNLLHFRQICSINHTSVLFCFLLTLFSSLCLCF